MNIGNKTQISAFAAKLSAAKNVQRLENKCANLFGLNFVGFMSMRRLFKWAFCT